MRIVRAVSEKPPPFNICKRLILLYIVRIRSPLSYTVIGPSREIVIARQWASALILDALECLAPLPMPISAWVSALGRRSTMQPLNFPSAEPINEIFIIKTIFPKYLHKSAINSYLSQG